MTRSVDALVLGIAGAVFVVGTGIGVSLATSSPDAPPTEAACEIKKIQRGEKLSSNLVTVNVLNASERAGLANRVKINLERNGFLGGVTGNYDGQVRVSNVTILTSDTTDPQVKLLSAQFKGEVKTANADVETETGVTVLVGQKYRGIKKNAKKQVKAGRQVSVCVPALNLD